MAKHKYEEKVISSTPRIAVTAYPFKNHFISGQKEPFDLMKVDTIDCTSAVLNINFSKSKSDPSGTFSITLGADKHWTQIIRPGDWLTIHMSRFDIDPKTTKGLKCLGNVDRVSKQRTVSADGKKIYTYKIFGRDFGKIFEKVQFYYNPYFTNMSQQYFVISKTGYKVTGTPLEFIKSYINIYLGDGTIFKKENGVTKTEKVAQVDQMRLPEPLFKLFSDKKYTGRFADILRYDIGGVNGALDPEGYSNFIPMGRAIDTNLWDALLSVSNSVVNEMFICMKYYPHEDKMHPTLVIRKLPYSKKTFCKLPVISIQDNMIIAEDLGFSDHERYTWMNLDNKNAFIEQISQYMVTSKARDSEGAPLFPHVNLNALKRYGLTQMNFQTEFAFPEITSAQKSKDDVLAIAEKWQKNLIEWWENYYRCESGTIVLKGFSEVNEYKTSEKPNLMKVNEKLTTFEKIKGLIPKTTLRIPVDHFNIGDNVYVNSKERLYQLEGVNYDWAAPGEMTTTLTVVRGVSVLPSIKAGDFIKSTYFYVDEKDKKDPEIGITETKRK